MDSLWPQLATFRLLNNRQKCGAVCAENHECSYQLMRFIIYALRACSRYKIAGVYIHSSESSRVKHQHRKEKNEKNINLTWSSDLKSFAFSTIPQPKQNVSALEHRVVLGNSPWHTPLSCSLVDREDASAASAWTSWWLVSTVSYH